MTPRQMPLRRPNSYYRTREYLLPKEVEKLIETAKRNRYGLRDSTLILVAARHAFRPVELVDLRWSDIDFDGATMNARRCKGGISSTHPILGDELRALRRLRRESECSEFVFVSERNAPFTAAGIEKLVERLGREAGLPIKVRYYGLRHSTGFRLANDGHDTKSISVYMGHRNLQTTSRYTEISPARFRNFFRG
jgi:integrase